MSPGSLRKHAHAIQRIFSAVKIENFIGKKVVMCNIYVQNIDCWYPQSLLWIRNKKNMYTPVNPGFTM